MVVSTEGGLACLCLASTRDEALAYRQLLADYSIPAIIGETTDTSRDGGVPILVPQSLLDQANDVITSFSTEDPDEWEDEPFDDDDEDEDEDEDYDEDYDDDDDEDDYDDLDDDFDDDYDDD